MLRYRQFSFFRLCRPLRMLRDGEGYINGESLIPGGWKSDGRIAAWGPLHQEHDANLLLDRMTMKGTLQPRTGDPIRRGIRHLNETTVPYDGASDVNATGAKMHLAIVEPHNQNDYLRGQSYRHWRRYRGDENDWVYMHYNARMEKFRRFSDMPEMRRRRIEAGQAGYAQPKIWGRDGTLPYVRMHWEATPGRRLMHALYNSYAEPYNQHRSTVRIGMFGWPAWEQRTIVAPSATISGRVSMQGCSSVGEHTTMVAHEDNVIYVAQACVIGDGVSISTLPWRRAEVGPDDPSLGDVLIGERTVIEAGARIKASVLDGWNYVGANAVLDGCYLEKYAFVADGSVVPPGRRVPSGELWGGKPARHIRNVFYWEKMGMEEWTDLYWETAWMTYREWQEDWPQTAINEKEAIEDWFHDTVEKHLADDAVPAQARYCITHRPRVEEEAWYETMMQDYIPWGRNARSQQMQWFGLNAQAGSLLL